MVKRKNCDNFWAAILFLYLFPFFLFIFKIFWSCSISEATGLNSSNTVSIDNFVFFKIMWIFPILQKSFVRSINQFCATLVKNNALRPRLLLIIIFSWSTAMNPLSKKSDLWKRPKTTVGCFIGVHQLSNCLTFIVFRKGLYLDFILLFQEQNLCL